MNPRFRIALLLLILGLGGFVFMYNYMFNKAHPDYANLNPEYELNAKDLYSAYIENANVANDAYTGEIIQIKGNVSKIETSDSIHYVVFVFDEGIFGDEGIRCAMLNDYNELIKKLSQTQEIVIKGLCTGYNDTDVIVEKCSLIK